MAGNAGPRIGVSPKVTRETKTLFMPAISRVVLSLLIHGTILRFDMAKKKYGVWSQLLWAGKG